MPKAIKKKIKQKQVTAETEVTDRVADLMDTLKQNQKTVLTYSLIALGVVIAIAVFFYSSYNAQSKAHQLAYEAYKIYYNQYQDGTVSKQEQFQQALDLFQKSFNTKKSPRVLLYMANAYFELGQYDNALAKLSEFTKKYKSETDLLPLAYHKMVTIHRNNENTAEALKILDTMYNAESAVYKDIALIESARILEKEGKKGEAEAKYRELADTFPGSPFFEEAQSKLPKEEPTQDTGKTTPDTTTDETVTEKEAEEK
jgi:predicted negative regulator of RcsB-dependent stress response